MPSYLENVESLFLSSIKKGLSLRAGDLEIVRDWERRGVPEDVISRGILNGINRFLAESDPTESLPSGLRFYRTAVEREFDVWQRAAARGLASATMQKRPDAPARKPETRPGATIEERARTVLVDRLAAVPDSQKAVYSRVLNFFDEAAGQTPLANLLYQVEDMLVTGLGQTIDPDRFKKICSEVEKDTNASADRGVGRKALEDLRRRKLRIAVAQSIGFESFLDAVLKRQ